MPCLTDEIDCLLCGARTKCSQVENPGSEKWSQYFCQLLSVDDSKFQDSVHEAFYCVPCTCKITSITKISGLVENMKIKLGEIKGQIEDGLILSNPHIYGDGSNEEGEKNQNKARERIMAALEDVKRKQEERRNVDACVETDPVVIVEEELKRSCDGKSDKECQCTLLDENVSVSMNGNDDVTEIPVVETATTDFGEASDGRKRQVIKIKISSDTVSQEIIDTLTKQQGNPQARQLIIRGYREIETMPQHVTKYCSENEADTPGKGRKRGRKARTSGTNEEPSEASAVSENPKIIQCKICGFTFKNQKEKKAHVEAMHKEGDKYKCSECDYAVTQERTLVKHYQTVHTTEETKENSEEVTTESANTNETDSTEMNENPPILEQIMDESDPDYGCPSEEEDDDEIVIGSRKSKRKSTSAFASSRKRTKTSTCDSTLSTPPVIKVASNKRISGLPVMPVASAQTPVLGPDVSPRKSGRLRSNYRTYFY